MKVAVSVVVLARDEEANIGACLASVVDWAHEVFVIDSGSTDRTVEIARAMGAQVMEHPFEDYAKQRNWAIRNLPLSGEWELHLDADERVTPELRREIQDLLADATPDVTGLMVARRTEFLGRAILHGGHYPCYHLRLFRRGRGRCEARLYDQHFVTDGRVERLHGDVVDVVTTDLERWVDRHNRWAGLEARGEGEGEVEASPMGDPMARRRWWKIRVYGRCPLFVRAAAYFGWRYVVRLGFLDGVEGLIFHVLQGFWFRFLVDARIWERRRGRGGHG